jgi:sulfopyruvate decarboxylase subunit beta
VMIRPECLRVLAARRTGEIVVSLFRAAFEWMALSPSDLNFTFVKAMGQLAPYGLGLALAFPGRRVIVIDGDGGLLMNLGCLVTVANARPRNLIHLICNNGTYETSGSQAIPARERINFPGLARAAGYPAVHEVDNLREWEILAPRILSAEGPVFVNLIVAPPPEPYPEDWGAAYSLERQKLFKQAVMSRKKKV